MRPQVLLSHRKISKEINWIGKRRSCIVAVDVVVDVVVVVVTMFAVDDVVF